MKFGGVESTQFYGKGTIFIDGKINIEDVLYVKDFRHNLLNVSQMCSKGYKIIFDDKGCEIRKGNSRRVIAKGTTTNGNMYYLKESKYSSFLVAQNNDSSLWHKRL